MKHTKQMAAALLAFLLALSSASAETVLKLNGIDVQYAGDFFIRHADVAADDAAYTYYRTTAEMASDLLLGSFDYDAFVLMTDCVDHRTIMRKGYCLDLSGSEVISQAVGRLHPVFAAQCMLDGKIYAIPHTMQMNYLTFSPAVVEHAGMAPVQTPATFSEFLDFAEAWVAHKTAHPGCETALLGMSYWGDASFYRADGYTAFLVDQLMQNCIMQQEYAGKSVQFDKGELLPLLQRCAQLGQALYQVDEGILCTASIVQIGPPSQFPEDAEVLSLRLRSDQPRLISTGMNLFAVHAGTENPELCIELMEQLCLNNWPQYNALFYQNTEPLPDPNYDSEVARIQRMVQDTQSQLARENLDVVYRAELELRLGKQQAILDDYLGSESRQYLVTAAELETFRQHANCLFVQTPGVFHANDVENANAFRQLKARFAAGQIPAEALLNELNGLAWMIEAERE